MNISAEVEIPHRRLIYFDLLMLYIHVITIFADTFSPLPDILTTHIWL